MSWLRRRLTVRLRLFLLLGVAALMLAGLGYDLLGGVRQGSQAVRQLAGREVPALQALGTVRADFLRTYLIERSLLFSSMGSDSAKAMVAEHQQGIAAVQQAWQRFAAVAPEAAAGEFPKAFGEWQKVSAEVLGILRDDTPAARRDAIDLSTSVSKDAADQVEAALDAAVTLCDQAVAATAAANAAAAASSESQFRWHFGLGLGILLGLGLVVVQSVTTPLRRTLRALQDCADGQGNLTQRLPVASGEIGALAEAFNRFVDGLCGMVQRIRATANEVQQAAASVANIGTTLAGNAGRMEQSLGDAGTASTQVREVTATAATSTRELSSSIREIAENTQRFTGSAGDVGSLADTSFQMVEAMGRDSDRVQSVVEIISSIARQTNLLALNASVEAARAGAAGSGFAVVAERVKSLSIETAKATAEIEQHIGGFVARVQKSVEAIGKIKAAAGGLQTTTATIAASVEEQSAVTQEFAESFQSIQDSTGRISDSLAGIQGLAAGAKGDAEEARVAAATLLRSAEQLGTLVGNFRL